MFCLVIENNAKLIQTRLLVTKFKVNLIVIFLVLGNFGRKYLNKLVPALPRWHSGWLPRRNLTNWRGNPSVWDWLALLYETDKEDCTITNGTLKLLRIHSSWMFSILMSTVATSSQASEVPQRRGSFEVLALHALWTWLSYFLYWGTLVENI